MAFNLLDMVKDQVGGQLASKAAEMLGESESGVTKALGGVLPTVLGSVIGKGTEEGGASKLFDMVKGVDPGMLGNVGSMLSGAADEGEGSLMNMGTGMLGNLMGDKLGGAVDMISKLGGIKSGSAMSLFKMATPFLMGGLSKKIADDGLDASGFTSLLNSQKDIVSGAMPSGMGSLLGLGSLLGGAKDLAAGAMGAVTGAAGAAAGAVGNLADGAKNVASGAVEKGSEVVGKTASVATGAAKKGAAAVGSAASAATGAIKSSADAVTPKKGGIWRWLILALLAAVGAYLLSQTSMCKDTAIGDAVGDTLEDAGNMAKDAGGAVVDGAKAAGGAVVDGAEAVGGAVVDGANMLGDGAKEMFSKVNETAKKALDGITFAAGSVGQQMKDFIEGDASGDATFKFNNLNFNTGSAQIKEASMTEIDNLAAILKAYEGVSITVEGHTDADGDDASNMTLSQSRADAVKARLMNDGIAGDRIMTKGYGETRPVGSNETAEGKAMNRRIEVKINK